MDRRGFLGAAVGAGLAMTMRSSDAADAVFPGKDWETATPESQGMTASGLDALLHWHAP